VEIDGLRTKTRFYIGEPIIEAKLFGKGDAGGAATDLIPKGFRVVSVKVDVNSGSGLILPGDRVDVLVHLQDQPGRQIEGSGTKTFLQNIKVFAVNDVFARGSGDETSITAKTISLLVTPQQANLVTMANEMGKIRLVMRSPGDESIEETEGVTPSDIFRNHSKSSETAAAGGALPKSATDLLKMLSKPPAAALVVSSQRQSRRFALKIIQIEGNVRSRISAWAS
jgi:pilus assembly protein CpaB